MTYEQHAPFSVQIELVEGCTMACSFCGINGIREKSGNFKYTTRETITKVASEIDRLGWTPRIEMAMHGEPSMHPDAEKMVEILHRYNPKLSLMMTSNGSGFIGPKVRRVQDLFDSGLNVLGLDNYVTVNYVPRVLQGLADHYPDITVRHYPEDKSASVHQKRKPGTHEVVVIEDITVTTGGNHSLLSNHAGQAFAPDTKKRTARCALPFREIAVRWDGSVALCCDDFRGSYKIGNVNDTPLDEIWHHPRFDAARKKLYHRQRDFGPCDGCTAVSYRVGLLPDPTGQVELEEPKPVDLWHIKKALEGEPYTTPVLRPWEKDKTNA